MLVNIGEKPLNVNSVRLRGSAAGDYLISQDACTSKALDPSDSCQATVAFRPSAPGERHANLVFATDDPAGPLPAPADRQRVEPREPAFVPTTPPPTTNAPTGFSFLGSKVTSNGTITLRVRAPSAGAFAAVATVSLPPCPKHRKACKTAARRLRYGTGRTVVIAAGRARVIIKPSAAARRALAKVRKLKVKVALAFKPRGAANGTTKNSCRSPSTRQSAPSDIEHVSRAPRCGMRCRTAATRPAAEA